MKTLLVLALVIAVVSCAAIDKQENLEATEVETSEIEAPAIEGEAKNHDKRSLFHHHVKIIKHVPIIEAPKIVYKEPLVVKEPLVIKDPYYYAPNYIHSYARSYAPYDLPYYYY